MNRRYLKDETDYRSPKYEFYQGKREAWNSNGTAHISDRREVNGTAHMIDRKEAGLNGTAHQIPEETPGNRRLYRSEPHRPQSAVIVRKVGKKKKKNKQQNGQNVHIVGQGDFRGKVRRHIHMRSV